MHNMPCVDDSAQRGLMLIMVLKLSEMCLERMRVEGKKGLEVVGWSVL